MIYTEIIFSFHTKIRYSFIVDINIFIIVYKDIQTSLANDNINISNIRSHERWVKVWSPSRLSIQH